MPFDTRTTSVQETAVLSLHGRVLVGAEKARGGFHEKLLEASSMPTEPIPAGSKREPPLAKAKAKQQRQ